MTFNIGCTKDWLDVNKDPNNAESASPELVFPAGVASMASLVGGYYNLIGGFWSQYWSQSNAANQYKSLDQYQVQSGDYNSQWRELYAGALSDLQFVIDEADSLGNNSYYFMATVMQAYGFAFAVDFYDEIPYTEAFQGDADVQNFNPVYDDGKTVYLDLIDRIDAAALLEMNELTPAQQNADFLFGGNMDLWMAFANTLKLKLYLRMAYSDPSVAQAGVEKLYADGAEFLSIDAALDVFIDAASQSNPLYESDRRQLNVGTNLRVSSTIFNYFQTNSDPRLDYIVQDDDGSSVVPMPQGGFNISSTDLLPTSVAVYALSPTTPVYFISAVESYLLQAEAVARGWGTGDAQTLYNLAVTMEFSRKGYDASSFISSGGAYEYPASGSFDEQLETIIMAKWAAFSGTQCAEAFFETCRTGYPSVSTIPAWKDGAHNTDYEGGKLTYSMEGVTGGDFPQRLIYPQDEVNLNTNFPGQTDITDKVWWNKK